MGASRHGRHRLEGIVAKPQPPNVLRFDFGPGVPAQSRIRDVRHHQGDRFEKAQLTRDYHWRCTVDRGADLSSAVT